MKRYAAFAAARYLFVFLAAGAILYAILSLAPTEPAEVILAKPAIYLYPQEETEIFVNVELAQGRFTATEPRLGHGWRVTAQPDGTLTDQSGRSWPYLFWEADCPAQFDFSQGFVVPGGQAREFLDRSLAELGLSRREAADFMEFWLPQLEENPYNLVSFQQRAYTDLARLDIDPAPDCLIRVFMAWKPLDEPTDIPPQTLQAPVRQGFTAVEWGGSRVE